MRACKQACWAAGELPGRKHRKLSVKKYGDHQLRAQPGADLTPSQCIHSQVQICHLATAFTARYRSATFPLHSQPGTDLSPSHCIHSQVQHKVLPVPDPALLSPHPVRCFSHAAALPPSALPSASRMSAISSPAFLVTTRVTSAPCMLLITTGVLVLVTPPSPCSAE